jgi:23S rRNA (guanosine2251-2'-O)-methyltransferase
VKKRGQHDRRPNAPRQIRVERDAQPSNVIYGVLPVLEALRAENRRIDKVLIADGARESRLSDVIDLCRTRGIRWDHVPRETFGKFVDRDANTQGVIAFTASAEYVDVDEILDNAADPALIVILDGVEDPRNFGAILRTAECAGVDGVIIPERRSVALNETAAKASAGAVEYVKVAKVGNLNRLIEDLKERNIWIVGTSLTTVTGHSTVSNFTDWDWTRPTALVMGGEGSGLHRLVAENCDALVKIPMYGKIDSLNVSVAAGVILFEARRQRGQ